MKDYFGEHPKFGMFGSIHTKEACAAEGGQFMPVIFSWMIHVFPYEANLNVIETTRAMQGRTLDLLRK